MSDEDDWILFDGPQPEPVREFLDLLQDPPDLSREDQERLSQRVMKSVDETISRRAASSASGKRSAQPSPFVEPTPVPVSNLLPEPATQRWIPPQAPPATSPPTPPYVEKTEEVPPYRPFGTEAFPLGVSAIEQPIPLPPFLQERVAAGAINFPLLTLEQYASLLVKLSLWPEKSREIHHEYCVPTLASRAALDQHWRTQFEKHPATRAQFDEAFSYYRALLIANRRG